jgi:hypothetical protein
MFRRLFHADIETLVSMDTLWETRQAPTVHDLATLVPASAPAPDASASIASTSLGLADTHTVRRPSAIHGAGSNWSLNNDGQIPNSRGVRIALGTGYNHGERSRRASRNGRVSSSPTRIPNVAETRSPRCIYGIV